MNRKKVSEKVEGIADALRSALDSYREMIGDGIVCIPDPNRKIVPLSPEEDPCNPICQEITTRENAASDTPVGTIEREVICPDPDFGTLKAEVGQKSHRLYSTKKRFQVFPCAADAESKNE